MAPGSAVPPHGIGLPDVDADCLPRPRLASGLGGSSGLPVVLVCAPAGYGKSTLVGQWAASGETPVAWLDLEEGDGEIHRFVRRLVGAIRTVAPDAASETLRLLRKHNPVEADEFSRSILADLESVESPLTLVLDDYSSVPGSAIQELVDSIILGRTRSLRLVILARRDPPLSLHRLLVDGRLCEIRQADLAFTREETADYLQHRTGDALASDQIERIHDRLEGWPTGLRLLALSLENSAAWEQLLERLPEGVRQAREFLCAELFRECPPEVRHGLLRCSILESFTAELFGAVTDAESCELTRRWLVGPGKSFVVPIEGRPSWFRLNRLFQEFLEDRLRDRLDEDSLEELHDRAAAWMSEHGHVGEAVDHALLGREPNSAARILGEHRIEMLNAGRAHELFAIAGRLSEEVMDSHLDARLLRVWTAPPSLFREAVTRVESALDEEAPPKDRADAVRAELRLMQAGALAARALDEPDELPRLASLAEEALAGLPVRFREARAMAAHLLAQARQSSGDLAGSLSTLDAALAENVDGGGHPLTVVLFALCLVHYQEGDLVTLRDAASRCLACLPASPEAPMVAQARRLLGLTHYQWNELEKAEEVLDQPAARQHPENLMALAHVLQARRRDSEADALVEEFVEMCTDPRNPTELLYARANEALIRLRQGDVEPALRWAEGTRTEIVRPRSTAISASLIRARILITAGTERHRKTASDLIGLLRDAADTFHQRRVRIEALALESVLRSTGGEEEGAMAALRDSLAEGARGGFIRLYLDMGPEMRSLLSRVTVGRGYEDYLDRIRRALLDEPVPTPASAAGSLPDPLTDRELEILALLGRRLSNKEIAARLYVSVATVKSHASTIYQKLHVHRRREAVEKAIALGILPEV